MADKQGDKLATPPPAKPQHPYPPHDSDLVAVEVVFPEGVKQDGKFYPKGATLNLQRGYALRRNKPGKQVLRVLSTIRYHNGPADQAEEQPQAGPLDLDSAT